MPGERCKVDEGVLCSDERYVERQIARLGGKRWILIARGGLFFFFRG